MRQWLTILILVLAVGASQGQYLETVIPVQSQQAQILCNPISNKIYASNHEANTVTIIDGATRQVVATRSVPTLPWYLCLNTVSNKVYCQCAESNRLAIFNGVTDSVKRLTLPHGGAQSGWNQLAYNATSNRLYVGCDDGYIVVADGSADTISHELHVGSDMVTSVFWNPATNYLFCSLGQDSAVVLDCRTDEVRSRWYVQPYGVWCYNPVNGRVYTGSPYALWVFSPRGDSLLATIPQRADYLCAVPFPNKVYVGSDAVLVLDCRTNVIVDTVPVNGEEIVLDTARAKVYVAGRQVSVLDARADTVVVTIPLPAFNSKALCWNPLDGRVYVNDQQGDSVYVLRDTTSGVAEASGGANRHAAATLVRRCFSWSGPGVGQVLDVTGRTAAELRPGTNDLARLPVGVYVIVSAETGTATKLLKLH